MSSAGCVGGEVGSECAVELSGDEAFGAEDGFFFGFALGEAAVGVAAGSFAVAEPDDDDHVQSAVGVAVACEVESVTLGAPARRGDRRDGAQVGERRLSAEPVDVVARGDEQRRGVVSACGRPTPCRGWSGGMSAFVGEAIAAGRSGESKGQRLVGGRGCAKLHIPRSATFAQVSTESIIDKTARQGGVDGEIRTGFALCGTRPVRHVSTREKPLSVMS